MTGQTPECRISFDRERGVWGYAFRYRDNPVHEQAWIFADPEVARLAADPHSERVWQESSEGDERVWISTAYKPGTVPQRMADWKPARERPKEEQT
jgi:hypothetical protein